MTSTLSVSDLKAGNYIRDHRGRTFEVLLSPSGFPYIVDNGMRKSLVVLAGRDGMLGGFVLLNTGPIQKNKVEFRLLLSREEAIILKSIYSAGEAGTEHFTMTDVQREALASLNEKIGALRDELNK